MLINVALCYLPLALPEAHIICGNVHGAHLREVKILPGSLLLHGNSHWAAHRSCLLVCGQCEWIRLDPCWVAGKAGEVQGLSRWVCLGNPLTQNVWKGAETMVEVGMHSLWKNRQQQNTESFESALKNLGRKKSVVTKKNSVVKPGRRKDTTKLRYTL